MNTLITERTPLDIAAEINTIKQQTCKILLTNAVEIGRRLKEAKDLLKHGEWGKWLKESVSYSQRTAERLMQIFEEYGTKLLDSSDSDGNPNSSLVTNLTYTQALILLGIPEEERDEFIAEHDVENMTKLELQQAVKDRDQAIQEKKDLQKDVDLKSSEITQLSTQAKDLEIQVKEYKSKYSAEQEKVTLKQRELEAAKEEIPSARKIAELENKLKIAETKSSVMTADTQFNIHRDNMLNAYNELLKMLTALNRTDPEMKEKYRETASMIVENMAKRLKVWPPVIKTNLSINTTHSERG
ncbi:DUF3102 domain-containing protein [Desulfosporosinus lacus]|uniref:DUF3102 domain-containing protein n=1 Tax=Desulfosporosinus lacus DSM 15449 TaxID=1121420 RepID=A0A1M5YML3_9FIRM|nr:DUF3102 domain-containing protein [Desulfosporosinus lacus]SHI13337.1 Protein of unknown function [Desulfosporosinus lacus DSM 15449]